MIQKWDIKPDPAAKNKDRHKLLIKGGMKDIFYIVKKLGSVCSRPEKTKGDFNFTIYLSKVDTSVMTKLKEVAGELSSPDADKKPGPKSFEKPEIKPAKKEPVKAETPREAKPVEEIKKPRPAEQLPKTGKKPQAEPVKKKPVKAEAKKPQPLKESPKAGEKPKSSIPSMGVSVPSKNARLFKKEKKEEIKPAVEADKTEEKIKKRILKTKWALELPLNPTYNFETLVAGAHNRFAHAAAMAIIDNPGDMYNPLLIFGIAGTGKTHFIHAVSYGLSASLGHKKIFVTDGIKFSRGVEMAIQGGFLDKIEAMFTDIQALIIDDVHFLMLSEENTKFISKLMDNFMNDNKQLVFTSLFPPKSLEGLEDKLGFQITQGWMVDLKIPGKESYKEIINKMCQANDVQLEDADIDSYFFANMMALGDAEKIIRQVKKLEKLVVNADNSLSHGELLDMLLGENRRGSGEMPGEEDYAKSAGFKCSGDNNWFKWGLFYPKGLGNEAEWAAYSLHEKAKELGIPIEWNQVFTEEYDSDEPYGIPFKMGDMATANKVNGIIVIGPQETSALGPKEEEFKQLTNKIMGSFLVKCGWVGVSQLKDGDAYVKLLMELI